MLGTLKCLGSLPWDGSTHDFLVSLQKAWWQREASPWSLLHREPPGMLQPLFKGKDLGLRGGRKGRQGRTGEDTGNTLTPGTFIIVFQHGFLPTSSPHHLRCSLIIIPTVRASEGQGPQKGVGGRVKVIAEDGRGRWSSQNIPCVLLSSKRSLLSYLLLHDKKATWMDERISVVWDVYYCSSALNGSKS